MNKTDNMTFPNACKGLSKVLVSQILDIIASVALLVIIIVLLVSEQPAVSDLSDSSDFYAEIAVLVLSIVKLAGFCIYIAGLVQGRKDEKDFKKAIWLTALSMALSVASLCMESVSPEVSHWIEFAATIVEMLAFESVVSGILSLAEGTQDEKVLSVGRKMRVIITIVWIGVIAGRLFECIQLTPIASAAEGIVNIMELTDYIFFVILLIRAKRMLLHN